MDLFSLAKVRIESSGLDGFSTPNYGDSIVLIEFHDHRSNAVGFAAPAVFGYSTYTVRDCRMDANK